MTPDHILTNALLLRRTEPELSENVRP